MSAAKCDIGAGGDEWPPRFQFASDVWPGLAKLSEEAGEVVQVIGKIIGTGGTMRFRDGSTIARSRLLEELADLQAALYFVVKYNLTSAERQARDDRYVAKVALFERWRREEGEPRG